MATGQNPSITSGRAPANPQPIPIYGDKWVRRTFSAQGAANEGTGVLFSPASFGIPVGNYFIDKMQVWNTAPATGAGIKALFKTALTTDLGTDTVQVLDYGSATSLAGVSFKIPVGHAKLLSSTDSNSILDVDVAQVLNSANKVNFVCHAHCWVQI